MPRNDASAGEGILRLDAALVRRGLETSRERAKERIRSGQVRVNGKTASRPSCMGTENDDVCCEGEGLAYVGRGGCKLEKAVKGRFSLNGITAMDIGASTGGFTDCLLKEGAAKVYAVDVGHGQLHPALAADPRVVNLEGTDARNTTALCAAIPKNSVDFCAVDVSFISLTQVVPAILPFLREGADLVCLVKPQFEAGRSAVGKNGVVKDARVHRQVLGECCAFFEALGTPVRRLEFSPITGGEGNKGNIEFLATLRYDKEKKETNAPLSIAAVVEDAHKTLKG